MHVCTLQQHIVWVHAPFCAHAAIWKSKAEEAGRSGALIEKAEVYGNHHESFAGEIKPEEGGERERAARRGRWFSFKGESISFLADEPVEKIGISEEASVASVDVHSDMDDFFFFFPKGGKKREK